MFVVICEPREDKPDVYGPFSTRELAQKWINDDMKERIGYDINACPNLHFITDLMEVSEG